MRLRNFVVDLTILPQSLGGILLYAIDLAVHLEKAFHCTVLVPRYHAERFERPVICPDSVRIRKSLISRAPFWRSHLDAPIDAATLVYAPHMHGLLRHRRQVITVHDVIAHHYPTRNFIDTVFNTRVVPRLAHRISGVITVSETSRADIAAIYRLHPDRVAVVHNGFDLTRWRPVPAPAAAVGPDYLLVVGANRPYKNALELLQQRDLWAGRYRIKIIASDTRYGRELRRYVAEQGLDACVDFLDALHEAELIGLYQHCAALVFPSLMEGFGRPPLEAMALGRPVILSDIPVHREFFTGAGIFVRPGHRADWETAFDVLGDQPRLAAHAAIGFKVARSFPLVRAYSELETALLRFEPDLAALRRDDGMRRGSLSPAMVREGCAVRA